MIPRVLLATACALWSVAPGTAVPAESAWQRPFSEVLDLAVRTPDRRVDYGPSASQFAELWLPAGAESARPVVVLIHGGCWLAEYDIVHIRPLAAALADRGFAVWALEYRRVGEAGGGWPGTFRDIAEGIDRLARVDDPRLDRNRLVFAGHSAGGHLALWAAARSRLPDDSPLSSGEISEPIAVLGLAAITDLVAYAQGDSSCQQAAARLMDGSPDAEPGRYAQASPVALGVPVPVVLLQGGADRVVPPAQADALDGARVSALPEAGHYDLIHPGTPAFTRIVALLEELLADAP